MGKAGQARPFAAAPFLLAGGLALAACVTPDPPIPGETTANPVLQHSVSRTIVVLDSLYSEACPQRRIVDTRITEVRPDGHAMAERWTLDRCGEKIAYDVRYVPGSETGLDFGVRREP